MSGERQGERHLINGWWDSAISTVGGASAGLLFGAAAGALIVPFAPLILPGAILLTGGAGAGLGYYIAHREHRLDAEQR